MLMKKSFYNNYICKRENEDVLVFNSKSGAITWMRENLVKKLQENTVDIEEEFIDALYQNGFVIDNDVDEINSTIMMVKQNILNPNPRSIAFVIIPTQACCFKCCYCFESGINSQRASKSVMLDILKYIRQQVELKRSIKILDIKWFGGEPLLCKDYIDSFSKEIINFCSNKGIKYNAGIITNGLLIDKDTLDMFHQNRIKRIQITLDGDEEFYCKYKGASQEQFQKVYKNILMCCSDGIHTTVRFNVSRENQNSVLEVLKKLCSEESFNGNVYPAMIFRDNKDGDFYTPLSLKEFQDFKEKFVNIIHGYGMRYTLAKNHSMPKRLPCGLMKCNNCVIGVNGELYRCEHHVGRKDLVIGNIKDGFYRNCVDMNFLTFDLPDKCKKCKIMPICLSGCVNDRINGVEIDCDVQKKEVYNSVKEVSTTVI